MCSSNKSKSYTQPVTTDLRGYPAAKLNTGWIVYHNPAHNALHIITPCTVTTPGTTCHPAPLNANTRYTGKQVDEITIIADAELVDAGAATAVASAPPSKEDGGKGQPAMAEAVPMATVRPYSNMTTTRCFAIIATTMTVTAPMTSATPPQPGRPSSAIFTIIATAGRRAESRGGDPGNR